MTIIEVKINEVKPGDVIVSQAGDVLIVDRPEPEQPDPRRVHFANADHQGNYASYLVQENGIGYWHVYKQVSPFGKSWAETVKEYHLDTESVDVAENRRNN